MEIMENKLNTQKNSSFKKEMIYYGIIRETSI